MNIARWVLLRQRGNSPRMPPPTAQSTDVGDGLPQTTTLGTGPGEEAPRTAEEAGVPELLQEMRGAREMIPFLILLVVKWCLDAMYASISVLFLFLCLQHLRSKIDEILRRGANNRISELLGLVFTCVALLVTLGSLTRMLGGNQDVWDGLLFARHLPLVSIFEVVTAVAHSDFIAQLLIATTKITVITLLMCSTHTPVQCGSSSSSQHLRLKNALQWVQNLGTIYRALLPIQLYYAYYGEASTLAFLYGLSKSFQVVSLLRALLHQTKISAGEQPSAEELTEGDLACPICLSQLKDHKLCVRLSCQHTYCIRCLEEWLEKGSNSCPVCREAVQDESEAHHAKLLQDWEAPTPVMF